MKKMNEGLRSFRIPTSWKERDFSEVKRENIGHNVCKHAYPRLGPIDISGCLKERNICDHGGFDLVLRWRKHDPRIHCLRRRRPMLVLIAHGGVPIHVS